MYRRHPAGNKFVFSKPAHPGGLFLIPNALPLPRGSTPKGGGGNFDAACLRFHKKITIFNFFYTKTPSFTILFIDSRLFSIEMAGFDDTGKNTDDAIQPG